jgi:hypothetical protein
MSAPDNQICANCRDRQWVCEEHGIHPRDATPAELACAHGPWMPCPSCNPLALYPGIPDDATIIAADVPTLAEEAAHRAAGQDPATVRSFSSAHPYTPACLLPVLDADRIETELGITVAELVEEITEAIAEHVCPRCRGPLPQLPIRPAGSHATDCRCVPICSTCGDHESLTGLIDPIYWPLDRDIVTAYVADIRAHTTPAILDLTTGTLISETDGVIGHVQLPHEPDD